MSETFTEALKSWTVTLRLTLQDTLESGSPRSLPAPTGSHLQGETEQQTEQLACCFHMRAERLAVKDADQQTSAGGLVVGAAVSSL